MSKRLVYGIGVKGNEMSYDPITKKNIKSYVAWKGMLRRCYSEK